MSPRYLLYTPAKEIVRHVELYQMLGDVPFVIDTDRTLLGIVTERDCIAVATQSGYFDERGGPVSEFMTVPVETVDPDDSGQLSDRAEQHPGRQRRRWRARCGWR